VRDVFVEPARRREGVARAVMVLLEQIVRECGMARIGLSVSASEEAEPARRLYERLAYRHAHGPYISSVTLPGDDGPIPVGAVMNYLIKTS
jgi:GNAT superfamily N-acetyltransferase